MENLRFAVLIDGENISPKMLPSILSEVNKHGEIVIKRIYGDWTTNSMNSWKDLLKDTPIRPVQQFRYGENAADGALIMDAIELVSMQNRVINAFSIVSSDSGYYNVALRLRELGMFVLGIGKLQTKSIFVNACNRFIYIENLQDVSKENPNEGDIFNIPIESIIKTGYRSSVLDNDNWLSLAELGNAVRNQYPNFDPRSYNYVNLLDILKSYPKLFELRRDESTPPNYWMRYRNTDETEALIKEGKIKHLGKQYGFIGADDGVYFFTFSNIKPEQRERKFKKGMKVRFKVFKSPQRNGESTEERNGKATEIQFIEEQAG